MSLAKGRRSIYRRTLITLLRVRGTIFVPPTISNETAFQGFVEAAFESSASIGINQTVLDSITEYYTNGTGSPFRAPANETFGRSP